MAEKLVFPTAQLLSFTRKPEGGVALFSSSLPSTVIDAMGWIEVPECLTGASLDGELAATVIVLTPKDESLKRHEMQLDVSKVNGFKTIRLELEGKRGVGHRTELRFLAHFSDVKGAAKLEAYMMTAAKSRVIISYTKQAQQSSLPGTEPDTGCIACNAGIPLAEGSAVKHASGAKCTRPKQEDLVQ